MTQQDAEVQNSLNRKLEAFLKSLTPEEVAAFVATLSRPIQQVDLPEGEVKGYRMPYDPEQPATGSTGGPTGSWAPCRWVRSGGNVCLACNGIITFCTGAGPVF
ncbi:MAG TPA: hypothetical protein VNJ09_06590 [Chthonomonadales bacterium]|nr:hypothetical protein [Chthonomonadales bacterium]